MPSREQIFGFTLSTLLHFMGLLLVGYLLLNAPPDNLAPTLEITSVELSLADDGTDAPGSAESAPASETVQTEPPAPEPLPETTPVPEPSADKMAEPETVPEPEPVPLPEPKPKPPPPEPEPVPLPEPKPKPPPPEPEPVPLPEPKPKPEPPPKPAPEPSPNPEPKPAPAPSPKPAPQPAPAPPSASPPVPASPPAPAPAATLVPGGSAAGQIVAQPSLDRPIKPVYPIGARRRGEEGTVVLDVDVAASGRAEAVRLVSSSGFDDIDRAARRAARQARFKPGRREGQPVPSSARLTLIFRLRDN